MEVSLTTASEVKAEISLVKEVVIAPLVVGSSAVKEASVVPETFSESFRLILV
jgi:hypothetical protein